MASGQPAAAPLPSSQLAAVFARLSAHLPDEATLCGRAGDDDAWPPEGRWRDYLLSLPMDDVVACERSGLHRTRRVVEAAPEDLRRLCEAVSAASARLGRTDGECESDGTAPPCQGGGHSWRQSAEKSSQVSALLSSAASRLDLARVRRVVDVGCGKGHLIARLRQQLGVPALGLDVDAALLDRARETYPEVETFEARDVLADGLPCARGDLVVGLHPCGALGESVIRALVRNHQVRSCALLMVPCCWHKQGTSAAVRAPLSQTARAAGLGLPLAALKKASMALDASASVETRRARQQLRALLRARGALTPAELAERREMDGIHPKKALRGLRALADAALARRGLAPPSDDELRLAADAADAPFDRMRRLSLLEPTLGELIELLATLDRALALEEAGGTRVAVFRAFAASASDRNLCIVCTPEDGHEGRGQQGQQVDDEADQPATIASTDRLPPYSCRAPARNRDTVAMR
jgi:SAM-dependent methyltransferase